MHAPRPGTPGGRRAQLAESWPLLLAGAGCLALGTVLLLEHWTRTIDHLSPTILFLAVGATGLFGGVASFVVGPEDVSEAGASKPEGFDDTNVDVRESPSPTADPTDEWIGRPSPKVAQASPGKRSTPLVASAPPWSEDETTAEIAPSLLLDPDTYGRPSPWRSGRLLHLSEEGALRVYTVEDALGDLEFVSKSVHARRSRDGSVESGATRKSPP
ncbi:MAG: hypothetical protein L3K14_05265 [Thermoplasmata archaeon]|nr:hypothetical protein [Thermoplasmata archaeon]